MLREHEEIFYRELVDALQTLCRDRATGHMFIRTDSNRSVRIALSGGAIKAITFARFQGQDAVDAIKKIRSAKFSFSEVSYEARSRRPLPPTEEILAELAEESWLQESGRGGGFASGTGGDVVGGSEADIEGNIFAAAQRSVGDTESTSANPFAGHQGAKGKGRIGGIGSVKGVAERLRLLRRGREKDQTEVDDGALAKELFGVDHGEIERSRQEVADSAKKGSRFSLGPSAGETGVESPAAKPETIGGGLDEADDAAAKDLFAAASGAESGLSADDDAFARQVFGAAQNEDAGAAEPQRPDRAVAEDLFAAAERPVETEEDRIARDLLEAGGDRGAASVLDDGDDAVARELFGAVGIESGIADDRSNETLEGVAASPSTENEEIVQVFRVGWVEERNPATRSP